MTSHFDVPGEKRPFCVVPIRVAKDRRLKLSDLRLLMALGYYANRAGVCWPSMKTLSEDTGIGDSDIAKMIPSYIEFGILRLLNPNDYDQKPGVWGHSNRYQLLWQGDEPVPTWEQIKDANLMQPHADRDPVEGSGAQGTVEENALAGRHRAAFAAGVEAALGWRIAQVELAPALTLALAGADPAVTRAETEKMARALAAERRGAPQFAEIAGLIAGRVKPQRSLGLNTGVEGGETTLSIAGKKQRDLSKANPT
jgi:hypothetical protein